MGRWSYAKTNGLTISEAAGPLTIHGHVGDEVIVNSPVEPVCSVNGEGVRTLEFEGPASILIPDHVDVAIDRALGPLSIDHLSGNLKLGLVMGPVSIKFVEGDIDCGDALHGPASFGETGAVRIGHCHGNLAVDHAKSFEADEIAGPLQIRSCAGPVLVRRVHGRVDLADLARGCTIGWAGGKLRIRGLIASDAEWKASIAGSATLALDEKSSARIRLESKGGRVTVNGIDLQDLQQSESGLTGTIGKGEASIAVDAHGDIRLRRLHDEDPALSGFSISFDDLAEELEGVVETVEGGLRGLGGEIADALAFDRELSSLTERLRDRALRDVDRFVRKQVRRVRRAGRGPRESGPRPDRAAPSVSPDQRAPERASGSEAAMRIVLRMVAEGKLSPEEAERLLRAAGYRGS